MTAPTDRCWLCDGPPPEYPRDEHGGAKFGLWRERLCDACWQAQEDDRLLHDLHDALYHLDGAPTPDCGCVVFADTDALRAWLLKDGE